MLHKRHNSVVTFFIILALVGVSKPAKAFLLAQSDKAPATFTVPDRLSEDAAVKIAASNSTDSISTSLKEGFSAKYPQAEVNIETQNSGAALTSVSDGQVDLAAIGRNLTAEEKSQGLIAVPVSREKIAVVISKANPYDGNLTIDQFAQIFRGEITDWSEIGGTPGKIELVDLPDSNDTRQAFPNYPVFQSAEFTTGDTAIQLEQDSTEAMVEQLGKNAISYAVANDVANRDDVKIVTMHTTQPDDSRYPFSQPFNLVYQGTPSEAAQAYLGFATTEGGQEVVTNRIGSISTAAVTAIASGAAADLANKGALPSTETDVEDQIETANADGNAAEDDVDGTAPPNNDIDSEADVTVNSDIDEVDPKAIADADVDIDPNVDPNVDEADPKAIANADLNGSGEVNADVDGSGEINPDLNGSGEVNADLNGSGEVNADVDGSGEINPDLNGSGEITPEIDGSGEPLSSETVDEVEGEAVVPENAGDGTEVAAKKGGKWWLLLIPLLAIPLLGALIFGGRKKSDQEPAVDKVPNINSPEGGISVAGMSNGGGVPPVGANVSGNLGNVAENTVNTTSRMGSAGLAAGGAALAGGAAAAANLAGRNRKTENISDADLDLDLDLEESITAEEIPSNPVTEFTGQETKLQVGDSENEVGMDTDLDLDLPDSGFDDISSRNAAAFGGTVAGLGRNLENETIGESVVESSNLADAELDIDSNRSGLAADSDANLSRANLDDGFNTDGLNANAEAGREFSGDYVLPEETKDISVSEDLDADTNFGEATTPELDPLTDVDVETNVDGGTGIIGGATAAGGAVLGGAAAAASGLFNREPDTAEDTVINPPNLERDADTNLDLDLDLDLSDRANETSANFAGGIGEVDAPNLESRIDIPDSSQDTDINLGGAVTTPELDLSTDVEPETNVDGGTGIIGGATAAGGAVLGGAAAAAAGLFNREPETAEAINAPDLDRDNDTDSDLDLSDRANETSANFAGGIGEVDAPNLESRIDIPDSSQDTDINLGGAVTTPELDLSTDVEPETNVDGGTGIIGGATAAGGAVLGGAAAAAAGLFNRQPDTAEDTVINPPNLERDADTNLDLDLDLDLSDRAKETSANFAGSIGEVDAPNLESRIDIPDSSQDTDINLGGEVTTPELDLSTDVDPETNVDGGTGIIGGATAAGGAVLGGAAAAAAGFFNRDEEKTSDIQEFETFETSFDVSDDTNPSSFADNVIGDAETIAIDDNDNDLQGMTLDNVARSQELNLDEIALDDGDRTINASLEEISFDDAVSLEDITLEEITVDDAELDLASSSANDITSTGKVEDIRLEDLGFAESTQTGVESLDLKDSDTAQTSNLSDNQFNDMNNISEWLDSLETPNNDSDNISDWLDTLDKDRVNLDADRNNSDQETTTDLTEEADDISFQFLEDLLDRDADTDRGNQ